MHDPLAVGSADVQIEMPPSPPPVRDPCNDSCSDSNRSNGIVVAFVVVDHPVPDMKRSDHCHSAIIVQSSRHSVYFAQIA